MKKALIIALLGCAASLQAQVPIDAIAHYTMDGVPTDASQNANHGTLIGGVTTAPDRFGYACGALKFDGVTGYISVPSSATLKGPSTALTVSVWVKMEQNPASPTRKWLTVACKSDQANETPESPQWRVQSMQDDAKGYNTVSINTDFTEPAQENLLLDQWFFYVLRYDGQNVTAWIDGKNAFTFAYSKPFTPNDMPLEIGRDVPGGMEFFCGTMDDLRIFDRALSSAEITSLYRDAAGKNRPANLAIQCPKDIVKIAPQGKCSLPVNYPTATATVDCGDAPVKLIAGPATEDAFPVGATTVTFQATGANGNTATCSFVVRVQDNSVPTIQCPPSQTVSNDPNTCAAILDYAEPTADAGCGNAQVTLLSGLASGAAFPIGETEVTYRATNAGAINLPGQKSKSAECSFTIRVNDTQKPTITCPKDQALKTVGEAVTAIAQYNDPRFQDNCPGAQLQRLVGPASGTAFPVGTTVVSYQVRDAAGLTAKCSFKVVVTQAEEVAKTELGLQCPPDQVEPADPGDCAAVLTFPDATLTGNLPNATVQQVDGMESGSAFPIGSHTITYTAQDASGATAECSFSLRVTDTQRPTITCPKDLHMQAQGPSKTAIGNYPEPRFADNCPGAQLLRTAGPASGGAFDMGTTTVVYQVRDASGLTANCSFEVVVDGPHDLGLQCPTDRVVATDPGDCAAVVTYPDAILTGDLPDAVVARASGAASGSAFAVGMQTIKYTAVDASGAKAACTFRITVKDEEPPHIQCPFDVHAHAAAGSQVAAVKYPDPTVTDNCAGSKALLQAGEASGSAFALGTTTVTFLANDLAGNTATCSFAVTVGEDEPELPTRIDGDTVVFHKNTFPVAARSVRVYYYDNHDQDGDTVSLNFDGRWIVDKEKIMGKKRNVEHNRYVDLDIVPGKVHYLVSKAWNEGKKPTNTLTIEIHDGVHPPRIFDLTSNIGKSSAIKIEYKK